MMAGRRRLESGRPLHSCVRLDIAARQKARRPRFEFHPPDGGPAACSGLLCAARQCCQEAPWVEANRYVLVGEMMGPALLAIDLQRRFLE